MDDLAAEARKLKRQTFLPPEDSDRLWKIEHVELPKAWRAVNRMREELRR